jgi:predicted GNAT family acetyltransferase
MTGTVRLRASDREMALAEISLHPAVNVFISSNLQNAAAGQLISGQLFATSDKHPAFLYIGGNAVPANLNPTKVAVDAIWQELEPFWPISARLIRTAQPYMVSDQGYLETVNRVRWANIADLSEYFTSALEMFKSEVGTTPPLISFQSRIATNLQNEQALGWFDESGRVLFKVDLGAIANGYLQLQGIWLAPELRGQGLSVGLLSEAFTLIQRRFDVRLCLYVNDFNLPAIRAYERLGFKQIETFSTVFF